MNILFLISEDNENYESYKKTINKYDQKDKKIKFNYKKTSKNRLCIDILNKLSINRGNKFTLSEKLSTVYKVKIFFKEILNI